MKFTKKIISLLLAVLMFCGTLTSFSMITVSAEEESSTAEDEAVGVDTTVEYLTQVFATPEEKLATMKLMTTKGNYQMYADERSGEVAVKDMTSGQILFTNPYDIGATTAVESVKMELMSQIVVRYTENGRPKEYFSYEYAAARDQIKVKNIKNGIRVEYTIGREEARRLVPRMIKQERFDELIRQPLLEYYDGNEDNFYFKQFMSYYQLKGLEFCSSDRLKEDLLSVYPVVKDMNIYVFDPTATTVELEKREEDIKTACPNYSYEEMDYDHQLTEYESEDENPPLFKMALEYTLGADGFSVRLPANGIRFNESKFQLTSICVLPYMGAGNIAYEGYTFFPDGSGALFAFEDLVDVTSNSVASKVYGTDYAYHEISGTYQQTVRYPVFGIAEKTRYYDFNEFNENTGETDTTTVNGMIFDELEKSRTEGTTLPAFLSSYSKLVASSADAVENVVNRGFVAIIEEGDAMAEIATVHEGVKHPYDSIQMSFYPRPQDTYNMADAISVGTATDWTVVSTRKYVGNYKIHYVMLTDPAIAEKKEIPEGEWYDATWMGMAMAYRDYLVDKGVLTQMTTEETTGDIPLYIEAFGTVETIEKILSVPVEVMKPLTTFQDVQTMYAELLSKGVNNINFKLTGHANGGIFSTMPYKLKWEKSVSKNTDFQALINFATAINDGDYSKLYEYAVENKIFDIDNPDEEEAAEVAAQYESFKAYCDALSEEYKKGNKNAANLGIFPDFDFSYMQATGWFDGFSKRTHCVRTIDDRYTSKRMYYATRQKHMGFWQLAISPAYFDHFYEKLLENYLKFDNVTGISVATLGDALNSDFDEDEPYNREDSKGFVLQALEYFTSEKGANLEVMVNGGNAYTWQYVDHILGAPLDSSRYIRASYSVPFIGVVLHGYSKFAGAPLNMEGDLNYAKLKAIENGAAIYFTLSYQNTQVLKESFLTSQYYSVRYDIWYDDVVEIYNELNGVTKDLQDKLIVGHEFLSGMRVPDADELYTDILNDYNAVLDFQSNKAEYEEQMKNEAVADARDKISSTEAQAKAFIDLCLSKYSGIEGAAYVYVTGDRSFERRYATFVEANTALKEAEARYDAATDPEEKKALAEVVASAEATQKQARGQLLTYIRNISRYISEMEVAYTNLSKLLEDAKEGQLLINSTEGIPQSIIAEIADQLAATQEMMAQKLGIKFDLTVEKAELDTFLHTHITHLIIDCYGEEGQNTVGKMENLFNMINNKQYGLTMSEITLLRFLDANRNLTDDEIAAKYELKEGQSSVKGLVTYMKELLTDKYTFDPILSTEIGENGLSEVDQHILDYFVTMLVARVTGLSDSSVIPSLNFVPTRRNDKNKLVSNTANISNVNKSLANKVAEVLTGNKGAINAIQDGNYNLADVFTEDQMNKLIDDCVEIIQAAEKNEDTTKRVEYATPETMREDLKNYIVALYYQKALSLNNPSTGTQYLYVMKVSYVTEDSIKMLLARFLNEYDGEDTTFGTVYAAMLNDETVLASIDKIAEILKPGYGDVKAELLKALTVLAAKQLLPKKAPGFSFDIASKEPGFSFDIANKAPTLSLDLPSKADDQHPVTKKEAIAAVDEIIKNALPEATADTVASIIAAVTESLAPYPFTEKANRDEEIAAYVNYAYTKNAISKANTAIKEIMEAAIPTATVASLPTIIADITAVLADIPFKDKADRDAEIAEYVNYAYYKKASEEAVTEIDAILKDEVPTASDEAMVDIINRVTAILEDIPFDEDADRKAEIAAYVYYPYLVQRSKAVYNNYYYDAQLGKADQLIRTSVKALYDTIVASLPEDADVYDVYNRVLDALTSDEYNVAAITAEIAAGITYHVDGKNNIAEDVLNYFCYLLLNSFEGYVLSEEAPEITALKEGVNDKHALQQINKNFDSKISELELVIKTRTERGAIPNYSLSSVMTDEEIFAFCDGEVDNRIDTGFAEEKNREALRAELEVLFKYKFYVNALDELGADVMPSFHVSEIYGDDLYSAGQALKSLMRWYIIDYSEMMTEDEIQNLIGGSSSATEDEEMDENKYISDDGRIVAVTYGEKNANGGYDNYRTFVLNYNNFSVSVVYDDIQYTIPAFSYVVIDY